MKPQMPHIDTDAAEREWQAQERARLRCHDTAADGDDPDGHYRAIARALREPLPVQLPPDFAALTARRALDRNPARLERNLMRVLTVLFGLATAVAVALYGPAWWHAALQGPQREWLLNPWMYVLAGCLGLSGIAGRWQPSPPGSFGWRHAGPG